MAGLIIEPTIEDSFELGHTLGQKEAFEEVDKLVDQLKDSSDNLKFLKSYIKARVTTLEKTNKHLGVLRNEK